MTKVRRYESARSEVADCDTSLWSIQQFLGVRHSWESLVILVERSKPHAPGRCKSTVLQEENRATACRPRKQTTQMKLWLWRRTNCGRLGERRGAFYGALPTCQVHVWIQCCNKKIGSTLTSRYPPLCAVYRQKCLYTIWAALPQNLTPVGASLDE